MMSSMVMIGFEFPACLVSATLDSISRPSRSSLLARLSFMALSRLPTMPLRSSSTSRAFAFILLLIRVGRNLHEC